MNETMTHEQWLEARKKMLTATDIAALCGLSKYKKPIDIYLEKRDLVDPIPDNPAMLWGRLQEPVIADHYAEIHGVKLSEPGLMVHKDLSWIGGTPDRLIAGQEKGLEIKTASSRVAHLWGDEGTDQIPDAYLIQCQWLMLLTDFPVWDLAVKIDSADYREYTVLHNDALASRLLEISDEFWHKHVLAGVPPEPDGSDRYVKYIQASYPKDSGEMIAETPELRVLAADYVRVRADHAVTSKHKEMIENKIKAAIGEASGIQGDGWKATWKRTKDSVKVDYTMVLDILVERMNVDPVLVRRAVQGSSFAEPGYRRFNFRPSDEFCVSVKDADCMIQEGEI